jgi:sterol desaturase/sphingolipid hydroxylase (fatty acid hydroxylase superfamily)
MIRFLWAAHIVHHSSDNFNLGTAVRNGWFTIFINLSFMLDSNHWFPARNAGCLHGYRSFMAVSTAHTICKKIGVHREISILTPCIKYTTHRILNIWIKPWWYS